MIHLLYVGLGGAVGSVLRYVVGRWAERAFPAASLPVGTLLVNVVGCLLIGVLAGMAGSRDWMRVEVRLLLMVGLLGGFTTFSTFGLEVLTLGRGEARLAALAYVGVSVVAGVACAWVGEWVGRAV